MHECARRQEQGERQDTEDVLYHQRSGPTAEANRKHCVVYEYPSTVVPHCSPIMRLDARNIRFQAPVDHRGDSWILVGSTCNGNSAAAVCCESLDSEVKGSNSNALGYLRSGVPYSGGVLAAGVPSDSQYRLTSDPVRFRESVVTAPVSNPPTLGGPRGRVPFFASHKLDGSFRFNKTLG